MAEDTELELLITVVVGAADDRTARLACSTLVDRIGGRLVESGDCSDEEPGCRSVTISRAGERGVRAGPASLSRAVRNFLRELGTDYARHRVSCEPPTAWTVIDHPDLVSALVDGGERLLVEAWAGESLLAPGGPTAEDPDETVPAPLPETGGIGEDGRPRPRLRLAVDVVTERRSGAEWPARALATRLSSHVTVLDWSERPPAIRVEMDLGPVLGDLPETVMGAVSTLGGNGWSRLRVRADSAAASWCAAPTPPSGIAAISVSAIEVEPSPGSEATAPGESDPDRAAGGSGINSTASDTTSNQD